MNKTEQKIIKKINKEHTALNRFISFSEPTGPRSGYPVRYFSHFFVENYHEIKRRKILNDEELEYCLNNINYKDLDMNNFLPIAYMDVELQGQDFVETVINKTDFYWDKRMRESVAFILIKKDPFGKFIEQKLIEMAVNLAKKSKENPLFKALWQKVLGKDEKDDFMPLELNIKILVKDGYFKLKNNQIVKNKEAEEYFKNYINQNYLDKVEHYIIELNSILMKNEIEVKVKKADKTVKCKI